jgi:hypothetical protein
VSKAWITAAVIFFFVCCALGGLVMAQLEDRAGHERPAPNEAMGSPDAGIGL